MLQPRILVLLPPVLFSPPSPRLKEKQSHKHPTHKHLRYDSVEKYEDLQIIFGNGVATGGFAIGMGDSTDARTFRVEDISQTRENINLHQSSDELATKFLVSYNKEKKYNKEKLRKEQKS
ncbi:hypothetical protein Bca52824_051637 [Brassica carinata]|uniref:Uncharacterized protein n=1 Tax=Brassica carinata TaxID=52824 RepID=A0A8X7R2F8_BRACI|nr:hypothetical protein Bca52824_051637 [Brassica carinata]